MKTQLTSTHRKAFRIFGFATILMMATMVFNPIYAQSKNTASADQNERTVKGIITEGEGNIPIESANVILKGTKIGTVTNNDGEFTFPKPLKPGDVLLISYLGYDTVQVKIKNNTTFIKQTLSEDLIEFVGALNTNKPYKSKR